MIEIKNLKKFYNRGKQNQICAVNNTTLSLPDTGMIAFFGKSGCGKTTLLNIIGGLDKAEGGSVAVDGELITPDSDEARNRKIGYIFQNYNLGRSMTVFENVASSLTLCGLHDKAEVERRVMSALRSVDMHKFRKRYPDELSGGQQQRVAIARAIVKNPDVILADEPTGNLDEQNTVMVMDLLKEISKDHLVLLVTHEQNLVDLYCDEVIEILDGSITERYQNSETGGFVGKKGSDVYLGDMDKSFSDGENVEVECFGEFSSQKLKLRLISTGGVIYLSAPEGVKMKFADSSSEIKIHEGKFEEKKHETRAHLDDELKAPIHYGVSGRIYNFKSALKTAASSSFGRKKRGRKALIFSLVLFSLIIAFMVSIFGAGVYSKQQIGKEYNQNTLFINSKAITPDEVQKLKSDGLCDNILAVEMMYNKYYNMYNGGYMADAVFGSGSFETISTPLGISVSSHIFPMSAMGSRELVTRRPEQTDPSRVYVSQAVADYMIESASFESIDEYGDLINLSGKINNVYASIPDRVKIAGVVEGDDFAIYVDDIAYAKFCLETRIYGYNGWVKTADEVKTPEELSDGEIYIELSYVSSSEALPKVGSTVRLYGKEFTIKGFLGDYVTVDTQKSIANSDVEVESDIVIEEQKFYIESVVVTSGDIMKLAEDYGETDTFFYASGVVNQRYDDLYYVIHAEDIDALVKAVGDKYEGDFVITPDEVYDDLSADYNATFIGLSITLAIVVGVMCLCLFFIMRSSIMAEVKQIGIYRAIGVSRKNLVYRYFIETLLIFSCTVLAGYLIAGFLISQINGVAGSAANAILYYPLWLALITLVGLLCVSVVCGLIPIMTLLRKTPAEIISKYDI